MPLYRNPLVVFFSFLAGGLLLATVVWALLPKDAWYGAWVYIILAMSTTCTGLYLVFNFAIFSPRLGDPLDQGREQYLIALSPGQREYEKSYLLSELVLYNLADAEYATARRALQFLYSDRDLYRRTFETTTYPTVELVRRWTAQGK